MDRCRWTSKAKKEGPRLALNLHASRPSTPEKAFVRPSASSIDAMATSQFLLAHGLPLPASRTSALTGRPAASSVHATLPPTYARNSCDGIHVEFPSLRVMGDLSHSKLSGFIVSASGTELS